MNTLRAATLLLVLVSGCSPSPLTHSPASLSRTAQNYVGKWGKMGMWLPDQEEVEFFRGHFADARADERDVTRLTAAHKPLVFAMGDELSLHDETLMFERQPIGQFELSLDMPGAFDSFGIIENGRLVSTQRNPDISRNRGTCSASAIASVRAS